MGIKWILLSTLMLCFFGSVRAYTQTAPQYYWINEGEKVTLELIPDYVVEFSITDPQMEAKSLSKLQQPLAERRLPGARIFLLHSSVYNKIIFNKAPSDAPQSSPLFKENGNIKGLAGGVFVYFKAGVEEDRIAALWKQVGVRVLKRYPEKGPTLMWLVETQAGLESLVLANSLLENHSDLVQNARPNFWQPIETRELKELLPVLPSKSAGLTKSKSSRTKKTK